MNTTTLIRRAKTAVSGAICKVGAAIADKRDYAVVAAMSTLAGSARADSSQGFIGLVRNLTSLSREAITLATVGFFLIGLCAIGYGGKLLWDKSQNRGDDITMSKIAWCFAGGTVMCAVGFFAAMSVVTAGGSESDMGRRITIN